MGLLYLRPVDNNHLLNFLVVGRCLSLVSDDGPPDEPLGCSWYFFFVVHFISTLESYNQASIPCHHIMASSVATGGGCRFLIGSEAVIPEIWHRTANLVTVSNLEDWRVFISLNVSYTTTIQGFGASTASYRGWRRELVHFPMSIFLKHSNWSEREELNMCYVQNINRKISVIGTLSDCDFQTLVKQKPS